MIMKGQESGRDTGASIAKEGDEGIWWELKLLSENRLPYYGVWRRDCDQLVNVEGKREGASWRKRVTYHIENMFLCLPA